MVSRGFGVKRSETPVAPPQGFRWVVVEASRISDYWRAPTYRISLHPVGERVSVEGRTLQGGVWCRYTGPSKHFTGENKIRAASKSVLRQMAESKLEQDAKKRMLERFR